MQRTLTEGVYKVAIAFHLDPESSVQVAKACSYMPVGHSVMHGQPRRHVVKKKQILPLCAAQLCLCLVPLPP